MSETQGVAEHYANGSLLERIEAGLKTLGARLPLDLETLAPVDEFHVGGRQATEQFLEKLKLTAGCRVLDMGCGLGGPARYTAMKTGARVTGIDLTPEFVSTGRALTGMAVMLGLVDLLHGSVLDLPFGDSSYDVAYMIHVGMNVANKAGLAAEAARVLRPGGTFGIYDIMQVKDEEIAYPVPWARGSEQSALATPEDYRDALVGAGFEIVSETDRTDFAKDFFERLAADQVAADGPPPLGLHLVMGPDTATKVANMVANIMAGRIAPIEQIARLRS